MDKIITDYIKELRRCDYHPSGGNGILERFTYNGISYAESSAAYDAKLQDMFTRFKIAVIDTLAYGTVQGKALLSELRVVATQYYDIPDEEIIEGMERDNATVHSKSLQQEIREARFIQEMNSEQRYYVGMTIKFLIELLGEEQEMADASAATDTMLRFQRSEQKAEVKVLSGTEALARFLGCGKSKAFEIISNGKLKDAGIQYKVGRTWKFNAEKLEKYLAEHPDFLK